MIDGMQMATGLSPQGRACLSETAADGCGEPSLPVQKEAHVKWQRKIFHKFGLARPTYSSHLLVSTLTRSSYSSRLV